MLIGNGARLASNPMRMLGGASFYTINRAGWANPGAVRSGLTGYGATTRSDASRKFYASLPNGYGTDGWAMPFTAGGLSSFGEIGGVSALSAAGARGVNLSSLIEGLGALSGVGELVVSAAATIAGSASVSANVLAALQMSATLSGVGDATGALAAIAWAAANLLGQAGSSVTIRATGALAADIDVAASGALTAPQIAAEILDEQIVETGLSVRETLRICLAALAGKVSGAAGATITFRSTPDHKNRIVADVDADGNRTSVTLDASN